MPTRRGEYGIAEIMLTARLLVARQSLNDLRNPQLEPVAAGLAGEENQARAATRSDAAARRASRRRGAPPSRGCSARMRSREPRALRRREPLGLVGRIGQIREHDETEHDGRQPLEQEQPLPAFETVPAVELEQQARKRPPTTVDERNCDHEPRHGARAFRAGKPVAEVVDDARQEAGLGDAEQEAQHVEAGRPLHEHHARPTECPT